MRVLVALALVLASAACGGASSTSTSVLGPTPGAARCQITFTSPTVPFASAQVTAHVAATRDCTWSAASEVDWLVIDRSTGQGDGTIVLAAQQNPTGRPRTAGVAINDQRFIVTQAPQPCRFDVMPREDQVPPLGGRLSIRITTLEGCAWTAVSAQPWMRVISGSGGESSASIEVGVDSNPGGDRSGQLTVAGVTVNVQQARSSTERARCEYSMDPGAAPLFPASGGSGTATVHVLPACHWHASSTQSWLVILSNTNGTGRSDIQYRVEPNPSRSQRSAQIVVGTVRHVVNQRGT